jgi:transcription initiation factor TFIIF subunit beta
MALSQKGEASMNKTEQEMIKSEQSNQRLTSIAQYEDDLYEDAGDVDFTDFAPAVYLARLPKFLWQTWSSLEDGQEIELGTIRVEGGLEDPKRVRLPDLPLRTCLHLNCR